MYCFFRVRSPASAGSTMPVSLSHSTMPPGAVHLSTAGRIFSSVPLRKGGSSSTMSNCSRQAERYRAASPILTRLRSNTPQALQLRMMMFTASRFSSRNTQRAAPRLSASMPSWPLPAYRSSTRAPGRSNWTMLNIASFTCERVGRVTSVPGRASRLRPRASPAITRMFFLLLLAAGRCGCKHVFCITLLSPNCIFLSRAARCAVWRFVLQ